MAIIEDAVRSPPATVEDLLVELQQLGVSSGDDSTRWIREERDARGGG